MAHHRYKTHEEMCDDKRINVRKLVHGGFVYESLIDLGDFSYRSCLYSPLPKEDDGKLNAEQKDIFCVFVPDEEVKVSPPEESKIEFYTSGPKITVSAESYATSGYVNNNPSFIYNPEKSTEPSAEEIDLKLKCVEVAHNMYPDATPDHLILTAEKIYKFVKQ